MAPRELLGGKHLCLENNCKEVATSYISATIQIWFNMCSKKNICSNKILSFIRVLLTLAEPAPISLNIPGEAVTCASSAGQKPIDLVKLPTVNVSTPAFVTEPEGEAKMDSVFENDEDALGLRPNMIYEKCHRMEMGDYSNNSSPRYKRDLIGTIGIERTIVLLYAAEKKGKHWHNLALNKLSPPQERAGICDLVGMLNGVALLRVIRDRLTCLPEVKQSTENSDCMVHRTPSLS
uniref:Uncharacterized protein n=1 Tax=Glossina pallidipes TaxID=7398 RepID=A0A1A9Z4Z2_GLOPL